MSHVAFIDQDTENKSQKVEMQLYRTLASLHGVLGAVPFAPLHECYGGLGEGM